MTTSGTPSPNYHTNRRTFKLSTDFTRIASLHGVSSAVLDSNSSHAGHESAILTTRLLRSQKDSFRIIEKYNSVELSEKRGCPSAEYPPSCLSERHFVDYIPPTEKKTNPTWQCIICSSKRDSKGKKR
ncbi:hypothetical protein TNCV_1123242 [Trichonephila clavipes]|uniref:Uncharacterized protein n=2 Tax=Trichonephila clavipes TaxID=2585209 RepID=A0A8X6SBA4_TRICX|nr:hypothetical protein TNCV_1123242 [Trichonephila clavipes]